MSAKAKRAAVRRVKTVLKFAGQKMAEFDLTLQPGESAVIDLNPEKVREVLAAYDEATSHQPAPERPKIAVRSNLPADLPPPPGKPN